MRNVLAAVVMTALVLVGTAGSAEAAKTGVCKKQPSINLKMCASLNYDSRDVWMTGQATEITDTALGEYTVRGLLQRTRCSATDWQDVAKSELATGNDRLQVITTDIRLQKGYRYRATILSFKSVSRFGIVTSPVLNRC
jgi:hypothetical protein